ncbi:MAG: zf-HC2 domain-containing protein [Planctomycetes bacterium]|nr:zf-HC2 domain-containing protein [Planctomycetota bacterium]
MECSSARLLLNFQRPGELDADERQAFKQHLDICPDCAAQSRSETQLDRALARAMQAVPTPASLRARILANLRPRRPVPLPWIAAAACLLLALGVGTFVWLNHRPQFDHNSFMTEMDMKSGDFDTVLAVFHGEGIPVAIPPQFNPSYLGFYDTQIVQGRKVAHLLFHFPGNNDNRPAIAHVFVLPKSTFNIGELPSQESRSNHTFEFWNHGNFVFAIMHTGGSLTPFLLRNDL